MRNIPKQVVGNGDQLQDCIRLDRWWFETAHLKYAVLMTQTRYPTVNTIHRPWQQMLAICCKSLLQSSTRLSALDIQVRLSTRVY